MDRPIPIENALSHDALGLVALCRAYQTLPQSGGLLDQDCFFVHVAMIYEEAMAEKQKLEAERAKQRKG